MSILAVLEQRAGVWNRMSFETLAAAQQLAKELNTTASAAVLGQGMSALAAELGSKQLDKVYAVDHDLLKEYTPDGYCGGAAPAHRSRQAFAGAVPAHLSGPRFPAQARHRARQVAVSDVVAHRVDGGQLVLVRQLFQGKVNADIRFTGEGPNFASLQAGAYRADRLAEGTCDGGSLHTRPSLPRDIRTKPRELFRESQRAVDLGAAEIIVSVGRGIKEADNIPLVQQLADVLGAELAASRPICDAGWLPMERQVGSSRANRGTQDVPCGRNLRRDSAPGRHEGFPHHRRH